MPYLYDTVIDQTISSSIGAKSVNLAGFETVAVLGRLTGPANAYVYMEVYQDSLSLHRETITLNAGGWFNYARTYRVFGPSFGITFYHPSAPMKVRMTVYAAI